MINTKRQLAAIDLGSNSFHMVVARLQNNQLHRIDAIKEMVRLAAGLDENNVLSEQKIEEALECLSRFGQRIKDLPIQNVSAAGTNTLRKARNSASFLSRAEQALGFPINIVAGREEARLVYQGVSHSLAQTEDYRLVIDIGGGSTEFIIGKSYEPIMMESLNMGCVNVTNRWFEDGEITEQRIQYAILSCRRKLEWISDDYIEHGWQECIGSSGTIKTIARILTENYDTQGLITYDHLKNLSELFVTAGNIKHIILPGLSENRAPVIVGGLCVLMAAFEELHIDSMEASDGALREGLLNDMLESYQGFDIRSNTVRDLEIRYQIDVAQSGRICNTAMHMYDQLQLFEPDSIQRQLLLWAGKLHEVGLSISHTNYPEHSGYIIEQSDMPGFSREMQNTLGLMVRLQRGKLRMELIEALPRLDGRIIYLVILLRIAIILERSRDWAFRKLKISINDKDIKLKFKKNFLDDHPLTLADLKQETLEVVKSGFKLKFK